MYLHCTYNVHVCILFSRHSSTNLMKSTTYFQVRAYDPDIADRNAPQNIVYYVVKETQQKFFSIDRDGCLSLIKVSISRLVTVICLCADFTEFNTY